MSFSARHWLPGMWLVLFAARMMGAKDPALLWALMLLTLTILGAVCWAAVEFVAERIGAAKRGERVLTPSTLRGLLIACLVLSLTPRFLFWDQRPPEVVAWTAAVVLFVSVVGLMALGYLGERKGPESSSFYFNPNWRYGLVSVCIATLLIAGLVGFEGVVVSLCAWAFWFALIALIVQAVGRWILRRRGHDAGTRSVV